MKFSLKYFTCFCEDCIKLRGELTGGTCCIADINIISNVKKSLGPRCTLFL